MPCNHKFYRDLFLPIDFEPETLIIGTFNPEWPEKNYAEWFYGRTSNNYFWDILPQVYGESSLIDSGPHDWKNFCRKHRIAITDLVCSIKDADQSNNIDQELIGSYRDKDISDNFKSLEFTGVSNILYRYDSIQNVYFTRSKGKDIFSHEWQKVIDYCSQNDILCKELLTPSGSARFQIGDWKAVNPERDLKPVLRTYILDRWKKEWHIIE